MLYHTYYKGGEESHLTYYYYFVVVTFFVAQMLTRTAEVIFFRSLLYFSIHCAPRLQRRLIVSVCMRVYMCVVRKSECVCVCVVCIICACNGIKPRFMRFHYVFFSTRPFLRRALSKAKFFLVFASTATRNLIVSFVRHEFKETCGKVIIYIN